MGFSLSREAKILAHKLQDKLSSYQTTPTAKRSVIMAAEDVTLFQMENVVPTEKVVGTGAYGRVIEVSTISAAKELHRSLIDFASPEGLARLQQKYLAECQQCSKLYHPNIVQFLGIYYPSKDAKLPWLVMEKMDRSLTEYLNKHQRTDVSFQTRISILHNISLGLQYLHVQDIIHRDLSSNNILLTKQLVAKIADLGVAKVIDPNRTKSHTQAPGTTVFMPPEALMVKPRYGKPVDVFSLGCVMVHMMTHIWPVPKDEVSVDQVTGKKIARGEVERREDYLELIQEPAKLKELILKCLNDLPYQRPSIGDISKVFRELKPDLKVEKVYSILFEYEPLLLLKNQLLQELQVEIQAKKDAEMQLSESRSEVDELTKELTKERSVAETAKDQVFELETQLTTLKQINERLALESDTMNLKNHNLKGEIVRLIEVDQELVKAKQKLVEAENELATKEFQIQIYKEDFEQERKGRENARHIMEEEIEKVRVEQEALKADHNDNIKHIQDNYKTQLNTYVHKVTQLTKDSDKLTTECARLQTALQKAHQVVTDNEKLQNEIYRLRTALDKEQREAQTKSDIYYNKTQQFQRQWKRREEAEKTVKDLTDQLNAQRHLNTQQQITIDDLLRKNKVIDPKVTPKDYEQKFRSDKLSEAKSNFYTKDYNSNQFQANIKNEETASLQEFIIKQLNTQHRLNQLLHAMDDTLTRKSSSVDTPMSIVKPNYQFQQQYQQQFPSDDTSLWNMNTPVVNPTNQQQSSYFPKYPQQHDPGPSSNMYNMPIQFSRQPISISEGINEEIRIEAERQRKQKQYNESEYGAFGPLDPYLICPKCKLQFREGQLPEYRYHIDNCHQ